jgi:3-phenylpropionate/trans-cinnamate dioxygenase ferredoxin subunit
MTNSFIKIADSLEDISFGNNGIAEVELNGKTICIAKHDNMLYGCARKCPHASGLMSQGWIDAVGNIVCPLHRYKFDLRNGRNVTGEGYYLKTYRVIETEDGVFVALEKKSWFF